MRKHETAKLLNLSPFLIYKYLSPFWQCDFLTSCVCEPKYIEHGVMETVSLSVLSFSLKYIYLFIYIYILRLSVW